MLQVKYFAYGSNILYDRLAQRVDFKNHPLASSTPYVLQNHQLVFNVGYSEKGQRFANIIPRQGYNVEGVLYDLDYFQFKELDRHEALYYRAFLPLNENTIICVYIGLPEWTLSEGKPDLGYLNLILQGCAEQSFVATYVLLHQFKETNYSLKKKAKKFKFK